MFFIYEHGVIKNIILFYVRTNIFEIVQYIAGDILWWWHINYT